MQINHVTYQHVKIQCDVFVTDFSKLMPEHVKKNHLLYVSLTNI